MIAKAGRFGTDHGAANKETAGLIYGRHVPVECLVRRIPRPESFSFHIRLGMATVLEQFF
jgi:hypothetical protein